MTQNARRNPVLDLPAARDLAELPPDARAAVRAVLIDLSRQSSERAETEWRRRKGFNAAYWRAVATYALHIARAAELSPRSRPARRLVTP